MLKAVWKNNKKKLNKSYPIRLLFGKSFFYLVSRSLESPSSSGSDDLPEIPHKPTVKVVNCPANVDKRGWGRGHNLTKRKCFHHASGTMASLIPTNDNSWTFLDCVCFWGSFPAISPSASRKRRSLRSSLGWLKWVSLLRNSSRPLTNALLLCHRVKKKKKRKFHSCEWVLCFHGTDGSTSAVAPLWPAEKKKILLFCWGDLSLTISDVSGPLSRPWRKPVGV